MFSGSLIYPLPVSFLYTMTMYVFVYLGIFVVIRLLSYRVLHRQVYFINISPMKHDNESVTVEKHGCYSHL